MTTTAHPTAVGVAAYVLDMDNMTWKLACDALIQTDEENWIDLAWSAGRAFANECAKDLELNFGCSWFTARSALYCSTLGHEADHYHILLLLAPLEAQVIAQQGMTNNGFERVE